MRAAHSDHYKKYNNNSNNSNNDSNNNKCKKVYECLVLHAKKKKGRKSCDVTENMWCHLTVTVGR